MKLEFYGRVLALLLFVCIFGCSDNLFGSGSEGGGSDNKSLRIDAENAFRAGKYDKAYEIYEKIVANDSTASVGYFGMAKAGLWMKGINPFDVLGFVKNGEITNSDTGNSDDHVNLKIPFMDTTAEAQNKYLQGMKVAVKPLDILERRDSLTALYEFHKADSLINSTTLEERVANFRTVFCGGSAKAACYDTALGGQVFSKPFPLSDREYKHYSYSGGQTVTSLFNALLSVLDWNRDGCIATKESNPSKGLPQNPKDSLAWEGWGCKPNKNTGKYSFDLSLKIETDANGKIVFDLKQLQDDLLSDFLDEQSACIQDPNCTPQPPDPSSVAGGLNDNLDDFDGSFDQIADMINGLGGLGVGGDELTGGSTNGMQDNLNDQLKEYQGFAPFYKLADRIDNDGDGCIDEEILDGWDSDGDGVKDEDTRLVSLVWENPFMGMDGVDNDQNGIIDDENEKPRFWTEINEENGELDTLAVIKFTELPDFIKGEKYQDIEYKLSVAKDINCPFKHSLEERKIQIGGCWNNYDNKRFKDWVIGHGGDASCIN